MSIRSSLLGPLLLVTLATAACAAGAGPSAAPVSPGLPSPDASPSAAPGSATPTPSRAPAVDGAGITHPTGADEVVLRFDEAGGFAPPEWIAGRIPYFTLYGDGRVVFIRTTAELPVRDDNVFVGYPLRTAMLSQDQVQGLLAFALGEGGLAIAKTDYQNPMVADAPTAVFTINAENDSKTVNVVALGMEGAPGPDTQVLAKLAALGERLRDFDRGGSLSSEAYVAPAYRGVVLEQQGIQGVAIRDWPWAGIAPSDFALPADANTLPQGTRVLTPEEAAAVGVKGFENGVSNGVFLRGPDGTVYSLVLRPLLPDESA